MAIGKRVLVVAALAAVASVGGADAFNPSRFVKNVATGISSAPAKMPLATK